MEEPESKPLPPPSFVENVFLEDRKLGISIHLQSPKECFEKLEVEAANLFRFVIKQRAKAEK